MKILTKQEEEEHYSETIKGGAVGGFGGLLVGGLGLYAATLRYPVFRHMSLQLRAFLLTSSTTFGAIVTADHFSSSYEKARQPNKDYRDPAARARAAKLEAETKFERLTQWGKDHRYQLVGGSWVVSIIVALSLAGRNPYLSTQQKLVQARVYAQGLTIAVMVATAIFEIGDRGKEEGRWETRKVVDPKDPEHKRLVEQKYWESDHKQEPDGIGEKRGQKHYEGEDQWKDMIEVEEQRLKRREDAAHERQAERQKKHKDHHHDEKPENGNEGGRGEQGEKKEGGEKQAEKKEGDEKQGEKEEGEAKKKEESGKNTKDTKETSKDQKK